LIQRRKIKRLKKLKYLIRKVNIFLIIFIFITFYKTAILNPTTNLTAQDSREFEVKDINDEEEKKKIVSLYSIN